LVDTGSDKKKILRTDIRLDDLPDFDDNE